MPIYEYRCGACGHELEALQKLADSPLKECPACGQARLSKLVSVAGFRLKGSGWYAIDFKNRAKPAEKSDGAKRRAEPAAAATTDAATTPSTGSESKAQSTPATGGGG